MYKFLAEGLLTGVLVSAPLGPIGVLCIQKTVNRGKTSGYISGLGAASADTVYAIIAGFGISIIINFLIDNQAYVRFFGGVVFLVFGIKMLLADTAKQMREQKIGKRKLAGDYVSVFFLTLSNPLSIITFGAIFTGIGFVVGEMDLGSIIYMVIGVFFGAIIWWFALVSFVNIFRDKFKLRRLYWINKISGVVIILFGLVVAISSFTYKYFG